MPDTQTALNTAATRVAGLDIWSGPVEPQSVSGGITNTNFVVEDRGRRYFVRVGEDIPIHGIMRFNELAASRAAADCGVSPPVIHAERGILVFAFIEGRTLEASDVRDPEMLRRIVPLVRRTHREVGAAVEAPVLSFWVFHVCRHYHAVLERAGSPHAWRLTKLAARARQLEKTVGAVDLVLGHNDLLPANFIDDGDRLWLFDWDYAGFGSAFFDLGGLSSNSRFTRELDEELLTLYHGEKPTPDLWSKFAAMKCASLLREALWSMVSQEHSALDFDYSAYAEENIEAFEEAWDAYKAT